MIKNVFIIISLTLILLTTIHSQSYQIIESNQNYIKIEFNFSSGYEITDTIFNGVNYTIIREQNYSWRDPGEPWLPNYNLNLAAPFNAEPKIRVLSIDSEVIPNRLVPPFPLSDPLFDPYDPGIVDENIYYNNSNFPNQPVLFKEDHVMRYAKIYPISASPFQYNPVRRELVRNKRILIQIDYNQKTHGSEEYYYIEDPFTNNFLKDVVINYNQALNWTAKKLAPELRSGDYWYDPNKNYFRIFVKQKGVYRVTFQQLINAGVPLGTGVESNKLVLYNDGELVPIDVVDGGDGIFNSGDYFQFVGYPPSPSPYAKMNLYNNTNVYWFSYQSEQLQGRYILTDGEPVYQPFPNFSRTFNSTPELLHFEKDSIYERLGYAGDDKRDFWFWGKASALNGQSIGGFEHLFSELPKFNFDSNWVTLRVNLHGMINSPYCYLDNKVHIELTGQHLGTVHWEGQSIATFERRLYISEDSIRIYPTGNALRVFNYGDACPNMNNGEVRINWFQFEYWKVLRTNGNNFTFRAVANQPSISRFWMSLWQRDNMKIYIPSRSKMIDNPELRNDQYNSALFIDTTWNDANAEYFCVASDYFLTVDSIRQHFSSDLRNLSNGADYIIITHPDFTSEAERLANFRSSNFPDTLIPNPRIKVVDVFDIYNEFTYGLVDPFSIREFVKYAFENWQSPAPSYIVLMGDMSHDYRDIRATSRKNFIPSIQYFSWLYGIAASDNMFVAVSGTDATPDLAIGRLSSETLEEAKILVDKVINYPDDPSKYWKNNVLLLSSGLSEQDENTFGFNDANLRLDNVYLKPKGFGSSKVFRYPTKPEHMPYQGDGPRIRQEFTKGTIFANYYGHGGGYQWDLVFTNDDIYLLENGGRLPFISSVTCFTSHFDNQDVFGEQFNKVPGKGSISFFGSSGLTYWGVGKDINQRIFNHVFLKGEYNTGKAILKAKNEVAGVGAYGIQVALLTLLGEPLLTLALPDKPDFEIKSSEITYSPTYPLVNDTVNIKVKYHNIGIVFPDDSVTVQVFAANVDSTMEIARFKRSSFGFSDSVSVQWVPEDGGLYEIKVEINQIDQIEEMDYSDNVAMISIPVFNLSEPNIVKPINASVHNSNQVEFLIVDIGHYIERELLYHIQIDTSLNFVNPLVSVANLIPNNATLRWNSPQLPNGVYFWRARIFDGSEHGNWNTPRSFTLMNDTKSGYYAHGNIFNQFDTYNILYETQSKSLLLNKDILPPKPMEKRFLGSIELADSIMADTARINSITTDGKYIYFATLWYYAINDSNPTGVSMIHKIGTGLNGTIEGKYYGVIPNFVARISYTIFYHAGYIYATIENPYWLVKLDPETGDTTMVHIPDGLINVHNAKVTEGAYFVTSDQNLVYNITMYDSLGNPRYVLRRFDPSNNWSRPYEDIVFPFSSFIPGFSGFFIHDKYLYVTEFYSFNHMRRINLETLEFEEEWIVRNDYHSYYSWCYDKDNNVIYASIFHPWLNRKAKFGKFVGEYVDANGTILTQEIGPASEWKTLNYSMVNPGTGGFYSSELHGFNKNTRNWDTLAVNFPSEYSLSNINPVEYPMLRAYFSLTDSSLGATVQMRFENIHVDYEPLPEIILTRDNISFAPDSLLQGFPIDMTMKITNIGEVDAEKVAVRFYINEDDSTFYTTTVDLKSDSSKTLNYTIPTAPLIFDNNVRVIANSPTPEFFTYNNISNKTFFVARDSVKPKFTITFDGKEIINGDIVSAKPEILISLKDKGPLPLDRSLFTVIYNNVPLNFARPDVAFDSTLYPNNEARILWTPELPDGRHTLEVLAKDASGNFFDTTSVRLIFYVFNDADLRDVYNYPNPFTDETHFTFELRGVSLPEEFYFKIYTVAGRLIRDLSIPASDLKIGFNKIHWDGRDQDGDEIANGVYFYKVIMKNGEVIKTATQKLAKVK